FDLVLYARRSCSSASSIYRYNAHRPHRALAQSPPAGRPHQPVLGANVGVLRRDRLGGLIREYAQVA
ncbi:MAG TPA: hypothetical protein VE733_07135, partial [Streptosporangiaceae bacterium]|nr:hypothetical protein [Streptosporangiaceae bacterium]